MSGKKAKQKRREQKAKAERAFFNEIKRKGIEVNLLKTVQILDKTITSSLCETVFKSKRIDERQRVWTLYRLVGFWNAVILNAPKSLRQALEEAAEGEDRSPEWPEVETTPEAFFQRSQNLSWRFFAGLYEAFSERIHKIAPACFNQEWQDLRSRFSQIHIVDASTLDAIAHRLKILGNESNGILPGRIMASYDLFRGYAPIIQFSENAMASEIKELEAILPRIPKGALMIADRLYGVTKAFSLWAQEGLYGLCRRHASLSLRKIRCLSRKRVAGGILEDWLVEAGKGRRVEEQTLRWIIFRSKKRGDYELLTNVLEPKRLSAEEALELYSYRWDVERLFYDLKEVLNLHCFYAGNLNAIGMQVYAAAMVHTAMRVAQGRIAQQTGIAAEKISTEKFFPRMAAALTRFQGMRAGAQMIQDLNPRVKLKQPDWSRVKVGRVRLYQILVEPRKDTPRQDTRGGPNKKKGNYKSLHEIMLLHSQN
jgi:hypothetical protein